MLIGLLRSSAGLGAILLGASVSACTTWHTESVAPAQIVDGQHPRTVLVGLTNGDRLVIRQPQVAGDSLTGISGSERVGVALVDIRDIAVLRPAPVLTVGLVLLLGAAIFAIDRAIKSFQAYSA